ncbi:AAA family ATPase, partial [Acinetobacter faecalis]
MSEFKKLSLPNIDGQIIEVASSQSILFIGANGAGKTRLGSWIEIDSPQSSHVHRIGAQKSLVFPDSTTPQAIDLAEKDLLWGHPGWTRNHKRSKWNNKPATTVQNDFNKLLVYLFSDETEENANFKRASKESQDRIFPPITKLDQLKDLWEKILPHRELIIGGLRIQTCPRGEISKAYNSSEMSDGERVIFYLIGQCLAAPQSGIIVIDEPEIHLHKSIQIPLWNEIEKLRSDSLFVYLTHDVDFASAKENSKKI